VTSRRTSAYPRPLFVCLRKGRDALEMTQHELGAAIGVSGRTILRWERGYTGAPPFAARQYADIVRDVDADLADEILAAAGVEPAQAPEADLSPAPSPAPALAPGASGSPGPALDSIFLAAARAADVPARSVIPIVVAAFRRAHELGISVDAIVRACATPPSAEGD
jgi:transcriptional regulator with XRE-family HTH domain